MPERMMPRGMYTGNAAIIPSAIETMGGIQGLQKSQNDLAIQEMKMKAAAEEEKFYDQPISVDRILTQTGFEKDSDSYNYVKEHVSSIADENGFTNRRKLKQLETYLKGDEKLTMGLVGAQIKDADKRYEILQQDYLSAQEKFTANPNDFKAKTKVEELKGKMEAADLHRASLYSKRDQTMEAFKKWADATKEQRRQESMSERQKYTDDTKVTVEGMRNTIKELQAQLNFLGKKYTADSATARKGVVPGKAPEKVVVTYPKEYGGESHLVEVPYGKDPGEVYNNIPPGSTWVKLAAPKNEKGKSAAEGFKIGTPEKKEGEPPKNESSGEVGKPLPDGGRRAF